MSQPRTLVAPVLGLLIATALALCPEPAEGQAVESAARQAWFQAVADHFEVSVGEVEILADSRMSDDEIPLVLLLARRAGVSTDALVAFHRGGRGWAEIAARYGMGAAAFHVPLAESAPAGPLEEVYERFRAVPPSQWNQIELDDEDLVQLADLAFVTAYLRVSAGEVLEQVVRGGSFQAAYVALARRAPLPASTAF